MTSSLSTRHSILRPADANIRTSPGTARRAGLAWRPARALSALAAAIALLSSTAPGAAAPPRPDHVVIVVEENHSFSQVIGSPEAPYINFLAQNGASLTSMYALVHPSQPNYLHFFSGSAQGVTTDSLPTGVPFTTPNLGAALRAAGLTFGAYSENLPAVGSTVESNNGYVRRHAPWVNWQETSPGSGGPNQLPASLHKPFSMFPSNYSSLPTVAFVIPTNAHNMHNGSISAADAWLQANLGAYADWCRTHNSLLIITWDEDEDLGRNQIPTIFYGPMVRTGAGDGLWTLHNLLRTIEDMYGIAHSGAAADIEPIVGPFTSDPSVATAVFQDGRSGYAGTHDTYLEAAAPGTVRGTASMVSVDGSPIKQGLLRFDNLLGDQTGQIPAGATILSAQIGLLTGPGGSNNSSSTMAVHRLLVPWQETSTWNSTGSGISLNDTEASILPAFMGVPRVLDAWTMFDVTELVTAWSANPSANNGVVVVPSGTDGWDSIASDSLDPSGRPMLSVTYTLPTPPQDSERIAMSFRDSAAVPGLGTVANEDVVAFNPVDGTWAMVFDGSDVGLSATAVDAIAFAGPGRLVLSFNADVNIPGLSGSDSGTLVADSDLVLFTAAAFGVNTAGSFSMYFDGSDVGLDAGNASEDIDGVSIGEDGTLFISTLGSSNVVGATTMDEDILEFRPTSLGGGTAGAWSLRFDGSRVGLAESADEDLDAVAVGKAGHLFFSTIGNFSAGLVSGGGSDILEFVPTGTGTSTAGSFDVYLHASSLGLDPTENVNALELVDTTILGVAFAAARSGSEPDCPADLTQDGVVDETDFIEFIRRLFDHEPAVDADHPAVTGSEVGQFLSELLVGCDHPSLTP